MDWKTTCFCQIYGLTWLLSHTAHCCSSGLRLSACARPVIYSMIILLLQQLHRQAPRSLCRYWPSIMRTHPLHSRTIEAAEIPLHHIGKVFQKIPYLYAITVLSFFFSLSLCEFPWQYQTWSRSTGIEGGGGRDGGEVERKKSLTSITSCSTSRAGYG